MARKYKRSPLRALMHHRRRRARPPVRCTGLVGADVAMVLEFLVEGEVFGEQEGALYGERD